MNEIIEILEKDARTTPEEIAKAVAHHNRHHSGDQPKQAAAKAGGGRKGKPGK